MKNKYDYGYEIIKGSTIEWAFNKVQNQKEVLELGPSNGNLARHLSSEKQCIIDIVEIDTEAGELAAEFSRNACLGFDEGDLEKDIWFNILKENRYDYVIILDVLEHIRCPEKVLKCVKQLLKPEGKILLSVPNIAHNSVIIGLLKNQFEYTSVGLLDNTHVHFYTYDSIKKMIETADLGVKEEEIRQVDVGSNEIDQSYGTLPQSVETFLKTRNGGTNYQFLFTITNESVSDVGKMYEQQNHFYEFVVFSESTDQIVFRTNINPVGEFVQDFVVNCNIQTGLRIDPLNASCILDNVKIIGISEDGEEKELPIREYTGNLIGSKYVFYDDDPQIYVDIPEKTTQVTVKYKFIVAGNEALTEISEIRDLLRSYIHDNGELSELLKSYMAQLDEERINRLDIAEQYRQLLVQKEELDRQYEQLTSWYEELVSQHEQLVSQHDQLVILYNKQLTVRIKKLLKKIYNKLFGFLYK